MLYNLCLVPVFVSAPTLHAKVFTEKLLTLVLYFWLITHGVKKVCRVQERTCTQSTVVQTKYGACTWRWGLYMEYGKCKIACGVQAYDDLWHRVNSTISICNPVTVYIVVIELNQPRRIGKPGTPWQLLTSLEVLWQGDYLYWGGGLLEHLD